jgi:hypothetical protein
MTTIERTALDKAIERAQRDGITILARGIRKSDGARVWGVSSKSTHDYRLHQVVEVEHRLICDCPTRQPSICKHRGLVHLDLAAEHAARKAAEAGQARLDAQSLRYQDLAAWDESHVESLVG